MRVSPEIESLIPYIEAELQAGTYLGHITRHILGLFHAQPGGRKFRRYLSENAHKKGSGIEVVTTALAMVNQENSKFFYRMTLKMKA